MPRVIPQVHWDGKRATPKRSASGRVGHSPIHVRRAGRLGRGLAAGECDPLDGREILRGDADDGRGAARGFSLLRQQLFTRVVPNLRWLGLLTPRVRGNFERMGILQFEHADPEAQDALLGLG